MPTEISKKKLKSESYLRCTCDYYYLYSVAHFKRANHHIECKIQSFLIDCGIQQGHQMMNFSYVKYGTIQWSSEKVYPYVFQFFPKCSLVLCQNRYHLILTNHIICPVLNMSPMGTTSPKYRRTPPESIYNHLMGT